MAHDARLVERARAGDSAAEAALLERYRDVVGDVTAGLYLPGGDRDDIEQEARIGLGKAIRDWRAAGGSSFKTFAYLCAHRQVISALKMANREKHGPLSKAISADVPADNEDGATLLELLASPTADDPLDVLIARDAFKTRLRALEQLTYLEREAYIGTHVHGHPYADIAERLGRTVKTVDNAQQRAVRKLEDVRARAYGAPVKVDLGPPSLSRRVRGDALGCLTDAERNALILFSRYEPTSDGDLAALRPLARALGIGGPTTTTGRQGWALPEDAREQVEAAIDSIREKVREHAARLRRVARTEQMRKPAVRQRPPRRVRVEPPAPPAEEREESKTMNETREPDEKVEPEARAAGEVLSSQPVAPADPPNRTRREAVELALEAAIAEVDAELQPLLTEKRRHLEALRIVRGETDAEHWEPVSETPEPKPEPLDPDEKLDENADGDAPAPTEAPLRERDDAEGGEHAPPQTSAQPSDDSGISSSPEAEAPVGGPEASASAGDNGFALDGPGWPEGKAPSLADRPHYSADELFAGIRFYAVEDEQFASRDVREWLDIDIETASAQKRLKESLAQLVREGKLRKSGQRAGTRYRIRAAARA